MLSLTKITALPRRTRVRLYPLLKFSTNSREDKPFTPEFNRLIRNQKQEVDLDREPNKPAVDWTQDQSLFPGARLAVEKQLAELELAKPKKPQTQAAEKSESEPEEAELPVADAVDPPEKPSHGKLPTVYVSDQHTLESKGIEIGMKPYSPEDDPRDKSVQWEEFKRAEIYELLRHMESFKGQTHKHGNRYTNAYAVFADSLNKADFQYLQHMQTKNERQIKAMSDDDLDLFITENRRVRLERHDNVTYDAFLDQLKLTGRFPAEEIEEERARWHKDHGERDRLAGLREPPFLSSREYMKAARKRAIWNIKDPRLEDLIPADNAGNYTYQDWEHELRRDALRQRLQTSVLPPVAEKALTLRLEMAKKPSMLGVPEQLSKYTNLGATLKPLKEFHQKMLRIYGAHYELGEPNPKIPMDEQLDAGLSAAVVTAADWVEPDKSGVSAELKATHDSFFADVSDGDMEEEGREIAAMFENQEQTTGANQVVEDSGGEEEQEEQDEGSDFDEDEEGGRGRGRGEFGEGGEEMEGSEEEIRRFQEYMGEQKSFAKEEEKRLKRRWKRGYKEPTTVAAYLKMINEMEYMATADINFTEEAGAVNAMARFPDARYSIGNETNMEPEIDEKEEYPEQPADKKKLRETHNFPVRLQDWEELKFKTKQHDAMPLELQSYFDPTLRRGNEEERIMLENLDPGMKYISAYAQIPSQFPQPRIFHVDSDVKEAIWRFNRMDPKKYHSRKLAAMFGLSIVRTQSILRLQYLEDQIAQEVGYDTELEVFEAEVEQTFDVPTAQWDPEFFNELKTRGGNYAGRQEYVDEGDLAILKRVERKRVSRYWNEYEMQILLEQNSQKHAYGALDNPLPAPVSLSAQKNPKQRYPVVLTEIADRRNGNFRIAVRDKNGVLREPDDAEFKRVRRRERGAKDYFNHIPYQFGEAI